MANSCSNTLTFDTDSATSPAIEPDTIQAAMAGDRQAYWTMALQYRALVKGVVSRMLADKHRADQEDMVQEILIQGLFRIEQLRDARYFPGWLRQVAFRKCIDYLRRQRHERTNLLNDFVQIQSPSPSAEEALLNSEKLWVIRASLRHLKEQSRQILECFYLQEKSVKQLAAAFAVPVGTIKRRLHHARKALRQELDWFDQD